MQRCWLWCWWMDSLINGSHPGSPLLPSLTLFFFFMERTSLSYWSLGHLGGINIIKIVVVGQKEIPGNRSLITNFANSLNTATKTFGIVSGAQYDAVLGGIMLTSVCWFCSHLIRFITSCFFHQIHEMWRLIPALLPTLSHDVWLLSESCFTGFLQSCSWTFPGHYSLSKIKPEMTHLLLHLLTLNTS